jgi:hypothetical protein
MELQAAVPATSVITLIHDHRRLITAGTQAWRNQREWR